MYNSAAVMNFKGYLNIYKKEIHMLGIVLNTYT